MAFENFPYTDLQTLNLDWLLRKILEMGRDLTRLKDLISGLDIDAMIKADLQEMIDNGDIHGLVSKFIPPVDEHEEYQDFVSKVAVSYLANMAPGTTTCRSATPGAQTTPFVAVYADHQNAMASSLLTYDSIIDGDTAFNRYNSQWGWTDWTPTDRGLYDSIQLGGQDYPVFYGNCSNMLGILTRCRLYAAGPYYKCFTDPAATTRQLAQCALEYGDTDTAPYTLDFMSQASTWRMAECMRASGNNPKPIARVDDAVIYDSSIGEMRDGDLIFLGDKTSHPDRYLGIFHCAMFFKDLTRLNKWALSDWGITVHAFDNDTSSRGYMVHYAGSTDNTNRYTNVLRIETLENYLATRSSGTVMYGCRADSNGLNSSKLFQGISGTRVLYDCLLRNNYRHNTSGTQIPYHTVETIATGDTFNGTYSFGPYRFNQGSRSIVKDVGGVNTVDLNDFLGNRSAGTYVVNQTGVTILNGPTAGNVRSGDPEMTTPNIVFFVLEVIDVNQTQGYTVQRITTTYETNPHSWTRVINYNGSASVWNSTF